MTNIIGNVGESFNKLDLGNLSDIERLLKAGQSPPWLIRYSPSIFMMEKLIKFSEMSNMKESRVRLSMLNKCTHSIYLHLMMTTNECNKQASLVWIEMEIAVNEFYWNFKFDLFFELHTKYLQFDFAAVCADSACSECTIWSVLWSSESRWKSTWAVKLAKIRS